WTRGGGPETTDAPTWCYVVLRVSRRGPSRMPRVHTFGRQPAYDVLRRERYTIANAARTMNVLESHLRMVVKGRVSPSPEVRERLPKLLNVGLSELFTLDALASRYDSSKNAW